MRQGKSALVFSEVSFDNLGSYGLLCGVKRVPSLNGVSDAFQGLTVALRWECFGWLFGSSSSAPQLAFPAMIVLQTVTVLWRAYMAFLTPGQPFLHTLPSDPSSPNGKGRLFNGSIFPIFTSSVVTRIWLWHHWRRVRTFPALLAPDLGKSQVRIRGTHILDHPGLHRTLCHFSSSVSLYRNVLIHCLPHLLLKGLTASL